MRPNTPPSKTVRLQIWDRFLRALNVGLGGCGGDEKFRRVSKEPWVFAAVVKPEVDSVHLTFKLELSTSETGID
jgi:hypothetical protein